MTETTQLEDVEATGTEVDAIVVKLEKALEGERVDHSVIGLIALAVFLMNPRISSPQLEQAIEDVTTFAALAAADADMKRALTEKAAPIVSLN